MAGQRRPGLLYVLLAWCALLTLFVLALTAYLISQIAFQEVSCNCSHAERTRNHVQDQEHMTSTPQTWGPRNVKKQPSPPGEWLDPKETPIIHLKLWDVPQNKTLLWNLHHMYSFSRRFTYRGRDSIVIPETGFYHVFYQLTIKLDQGQAAQSALMQKTPHLVHRVGLASAVAHYGPADDTTSVLSGAFCFETDTEIYVQVDYPEQVQKDHAKTFFGAFQIDRASSCTKQ